MMPKVKRWDTGKDVQSSARGVVLNPTPLEKVDS
jgi:hypothetical protein